MDVSNPNYHLVMHAAAALDPACATIEGKIELSSDFKHKLEQIKNEIQQLDRRIGCGVFSGSYFVNEAESLLNPDIWMKTAITHYVADYFGVDLHLALKQLFSTHLYFCSLSTVLELYRARNGKIDPIILNAYRVLAMYRRSIRFTYYPATTLSCPTEGECVKFDDDFNIVSDKNAPYTYWAYARDFAQYLRNAAKRS